MLQVSHIRENRQAVIDALAKRKVDALDQIDLAISLDDKRKHAQFTLDQNLAEAKRIASEIGRMMKEGNSAGANSAKEKTSELKKYNQELELELRQLEKDLLDLLATIPNTPHSSVPEGRNSEDNETVRSWGEASDAKHATPHWDLAKTYGLIDFELGVKITGAGFPVYLGKGAKLQRALI